VYNTINNKSSQAFNSTDKNTKYRRTLSGTHGIEQFKVRLVREQDKDKIYTISASGYDILEVNFKENADRVIEFLVNRKVFGSRKVFQRKLTKKPKLRILDGFSGLSIDELSTLKGAFNALDKPTKPIGRKRKKLRGYKPSTINNKG